MKNKEKIINKKYHTCGRCKHEHTPENEYPCVSCIYGTGYGADLWEYKEESKNKKEETNTVLLTKESFEQLKEKASALDKIRDEIKY